MFSTRYFSKKSNLAAGPCQKPRQAELGWRRPMPGYDSQIPIVPPISRGKVGARSSRDLAPNAQPQRLCEDAQSRSVLCSWTLRRHCVSVLH